METKKVRAKLLGAEEDWQGRIQGRLSEKFQDLYDKLLDKQDREIESQVSNLKKYPPPRQRELRQSQRKREEDILHKRFDNVRRDMELRQNMERQKLAKEFAVKKRAMESSTAKVGLRF